MRQYLLSVAVVAISSVISVPLRTHLALPTSSMIYLLGVIIVSMRCHRRAAVLNALLSVTAFYYFCVPVHNSFVLEDSNYIITLLAIGKQIRHQNIRRPLEEVIVRISKSVIHSRKINGG